MPPINSPEVAQIIRDAAQPIVRTQRLAFYQAVIDALALEPVVGVGNAHRICRELQKRFLHALQEAS